MKTKWCYYWFLNRKECLSFRSRKSEISFPRFPELTFVEYNANLLSKTSIAIKKNGKFVNGFALHWMNFRNVTKFSVWLNTEKTRKVTDSDRYVYLSFPEKHNHNNWWIFRIIFRSWWCFPNIPPELPKFYPRAS